MKTEERIRDALRTSRNTLIRELESPVSSISGTTLVEMHSRYETLQWVLDEERKQ